MLHKFKTHIIILPLLDDSQSEYITNLICSKAMSNYPRVNLTVHKHY